MEWILCLVSMFMVHAYFSYYAFGSSVVLHSCQDYKPHACFLFFMVDLFTQVFLNCVCINIKQLLSK